GLIHIHFPLAAETFYNKNKAPLQPFDTEEILLTFSWKRALDLSQLKSAFSEWESARVSERSTSTEFWRLRLHTMLMLLCQFAIHLPNETSKINILVDSLALHLQQYHQHAPPIEDDVLIKKVLYRAIKVLNKSHGADGIMQGDKLAWTCKSLGILKNS